MLPAAVKNKIEQIWLDVIAGGVSQPTEVIEQLTYLMFAKQLDEREADIETAELLSGQKQEHIFGESKEEQALRWRNFKGMEARELHRHFIEQVVDYVVENGCIDNVIDLMKAPFDRPYKFSAIFSREEQMKFVQIIKCIKENALAA